jgi:hypothetical protein
MSWKFSMEATCDGCGKSLIPENLNLDSLTTIEGIKTMRWCIERQWAREGVMQGLANLAGKRRMLCADCADGKTVVARRQT